MNNPTRKRIAELSAQIDALKNEIEELADEEQEKFDNMPEGLQQGENGQKIEAAATALSDANDALQEPPASRNPAAARKGAPGASQRPRRFSS